MSGVFEEPPRCNYDAFVISSLRSSRSLAQLSYFQLVASLLAIPHLKSKYKNTKNILPVASIISAIRYDKTVP